MAGRLDKYYGEVCLAEQAFIMDGDLKVWQRCWARLRNGEVPCVLWGSASAAGGGCMSEECSRPAPCSCAAVVKTKAAPRPELVADRILLVSMVPSRLPLPSARRLQVQDVLKRTGKQVGSELRLTGFLRVQVGEGLEQEQKDFAAEVAETLKAAA